ncbi:hypothetical protein LOTGIDRAFT_158859 [Lottia gigantea]|uniref:Apple domain-containing protein n=1 Tax=Lottia gigantea TaxID=225164 RepID=V4ANZ3_LOTGI|nr:hypothetical protein LOTGIDRAFT_158859 [Lottia gigantea]ESO98902.1 hypothetical protein LOTGIDRAFT_158859 [Lottia gigantea]
MLVILLKLLMLLNTCKTCEITTKMFKSYTKDKLLSGYYQTTTAADQLSCTSSCFFNERCVGLAYHELRKMCYLYDKIQVCYNSSVDVGVNTFFLEDIFIKNIALNKPSYSSSTYEIYLSCCAVDGILTTMAHTQNSELEWWCVDLEQVFNLQYIEIHNVYSVGHPG